MSQSLRLPEQPLIKLRLPSTNSSSRHSQSNLLGNVPLSLPLQLRSLVGRGSSQIPLSRSLFVPVLAQQLPLSLLLVAESGAGRGRLDAGAFVARFLRELAQVFLLLFFFLLGQLAFELGARLDGLAGFSVGYVERFR